jgi:two-component system, chemotaxis family, response regulator Rcp1
MVTTEEDIYILLVEDNPGDVRLIREALKQCPQRLSIDVASSGEDALTILRQEGLYSETPRPRIILLDLNLPGISGLEVLEYLENDPILKNIPVVVLTSSNAESDIVAAYSRHANCYTTKPTNFEDFELLMKRFGEYWLTVVALPPVHDLNRENADPAD